MTGYTEFKKTMQVNGEDVSFLVYVLPGSRQEVIRASEALRLADRCGIHSIKIERLEAVQDNFYFVGNDYDKWGKKYQRGIRYVATASCKDNKGNTWQMIGSAGPDTLEYPFWRYAPEMASKRAIVRVILKALGLNEVNADIEFANLIGPEINNDGQKNENMANGEKEPQEQVSVSGENKTQNVIGPKETKRLMLILKNKSCSREQIIELLGKYLGITPEDIDKVTYPFIAKKMQYAKYEHLPVIQKILLNLPDNQKAS